ncbi:phosphatase 2C-like domain-containing protein [Mycena floridula]|nr:phosphatase 2C-like domain-containing protein [Mycena floridula]
MAQTLLHRPSFSWAYSEDIPGSRCGPDDGPWPRSYKILDEAAIWRELRMLARPQTVQFDANWRADSINFQPSPTTRTQDRYVVKQIRVKDRLWSLTGVFDGHLGDVTVEHVAHHLPIIIQEFLEQAGDLDDPEDISNLFSRSIIAFDDAIAGDVLNLFGGSIESLAEYSDTEIRETINDQHHGGANFRKARLNMYGTTALVALVDPTHRHLWIANLGDCQAMLVTKHNDWQVEVLTTEHNGSNQDELDRVRNEHPGEPECVYDSRVLGALAPTRCLGDTPFKQPPEFTRRILYNLLPGFHDTSPWEDFLVRNQTPPYISAEPEITYRRLEPSETPRFLILCSDGFADLCSGEGQRRVVADWARNMVTGTEVLPSSPTVMSPLSSSPMSPTVPGTESSNMALRLLRRALGGEDRFSVSRVLTLDMDGAWIDDTSIVVQTI